LPDKIVFLDRDGVINQKAAEHDYISSWDDFHFLPDVPEAIRILNEAGYRIAVVTNQRGIALGCLTSERLEYLHSRMLNKLAKKKACVEWVFYCPHDNGECDCRKPGIGLFLRLEQFVDVRKSASWMIGDSPTDIQAGNAYGVKTIFIGEHDESAAYCCDNLLDAAILIKESCKCKC
jgi:histidinol-phosphate phosphatase family protein